MTNDGVEVPQGMTVVSADRFFEVVGPMDVHPTSLAHHSTWETPQRRVVGRSVPGYQRPGDPKVYMLADDLA